MKSMLSDYLAVKISIHQILFKIGIETYIHPEVLQSLKLTQVFLQFGVNSWSLVLRVF